MDKKDLNRIDTSVKANFMPEYEPPRVVDLGGTTTGLGVALNCTSGAAAGGNCATGSGVLA